MIINRKPFVYRFNGKELRIYSTYFTYDNMVYDYENISNVSIATDFTNDQLSLDISTHTYQLNIVVDNTFMNRLRFYIIAGIIMKDNKHLNKED